MPGFSNMQVTNDESIFFLPKNTSLRTQPKMIAVDNMWELVLHVESRNLLLLENTFHVFRGSFQCSMLTLHLLIPPTAFASSAPVLPVFLRRDLRACCPL